MSTTPLTRNECYDVRKIQARLADDDSRLDELEALAVANEVGDGTITTAKLDDDAVTTDKLDDAAVTTAKIDDEAVTGAKIPAAAFASYVVAAGNGVGARTMTGANVGDKVIACVNLTDGTNDLGAGDVEAVITVDDQIQQLQTNHTGDKWLVLVVAA